MSDASGSAVFEIPAVKPRPERIAQWLTASLSDGRAFVRLRGDSAQACVAAFGACRLARPVMATDASGATRPFHPIIKATDRGETTRASALPFELVVRRFVIEGQPPDELASADGVLEDGDRRHYFFFAP